EEEPEKKRERPGEVKGETIDQIISDPDLQIDQPDADRILAETGGSRDPATAPPRRTVLEPKEEKVVFELEYIDGKWQLANEDVETSLTSARRTLETALARQR